MADTPPKPSPSEMVAASEIGLELTDALRGITETRRPSPNTLFTGLLTMAACQAIRAGWSAEAFAARARAVFVHITERVES